MSLGRKTIYPHKNVVNIAGTPRLSNIASWEVVRAVLHVFPVYLKAFFRCPVLKCQNDTMKIYRLVFQRPGFKTSTY